MTDTVAPAAGPTVKEQGGALLAHAAGYASHRTITTGLRSGLLAELDRAPDGATAGQLAERLGMDPFYVSVWCVQRAGAARDVRPLRGRPGLGGADVVGRHQP